MHDERRTRRGPSTPGPPWSASTSATCPPSRSTTAGPLRLAAAIPAGVVAVAESGIAGPDDAARLADAGYQAVLVGEALVRSGDRAAAVAALRGHRVRARPAVGRVTRWPTVSDDLLVKICGITSEADALLAIGLGADALGFIFAPSPRQVSAAAVADIVKRLPFGVLTVGVFRDEAPARVVEIANHIGLGAVQLHGHETAEDSPLGAPAGADDHQGLRRPGIGPSAVSPSSGPTTC